MINTNNINNLYATVESSVVRRLSTITIIPNTVSDKWKFKFFYAIKNSGFTASLRFEKSSSLYSQFTNIPAALQRYSNYFLCKVLDISFESSNDRFCDIKTRLN